MFDMGFLEILLIGVIALIVIGPEKLPAVARNVGLWVGKMQRFVAGVKRDIANELETEELRSMLNSQESQIQELKDMVNEAKSDLQRTASDAQKAVEEGLDDAASHIEEAKAELSINEQENDVKMREIARDAGYDVYDEAKNGSDIDDPGAEADVGKSA